MYDSTVRSMGFDEIRVRYRRQRRDILRHIILNKLSGETLQQYVSSQTSEWVQIEDQPSFIGDVMEDLKELDSSRIAGLGITQEHLSEFLNRTL